ncbi:protein kinase [Rhodococcus sp. WS3]|nr:MULTISPECIES: protein kinase [unclassified Rhodococcus (in: high G+C Gram-positive bacteria)]KJF19139.1 Serine/threonine-protein kinase pknK [Rhodococcus sp. AD45]ROZ42859.1 protein kinase [Rhodococcus sp. WS3]RZL20721.1 MAG: protein kinase [Rhodococcus sp. (in: high G+C Gram-positive bacteria)]
MPGDDPFATQRGVPPSVTSELDAVGFTDATEIGRGGFGVVYRCTETTLDRTVAVKVLTADLDEENRTRFVREQRAMGRLTGHPNIVNVLQVGTTASGHPYIVMPYHAQRSLDVRIREQGPLSLEQTLQLGVKLAGAVESAHRLAILHRDIKPANVILTDYGESALSDFGIAHIPDGFETSTGTFTATPAFTAPEILGGGPPSAAADVYALGATVFCALTGHAAFERRSGEQVVAQFVRITSEPVPDLRELDIPDDVAAAIERAMSANPGARPTAAQLGDVLREIQFRHGLPVDEMALLSAAVPKGGDRRPSTSGGPAPTGPSTRGRKGNLPAELTSFVNRRSELTEAKEMLSTSRLVMLTGIGGVGKTRLALRIATSVRRAFRDGVWLVELADLRDESLVVGVVASALGLKSFSHEPLQTVLAEFLEPRQILLVLDNCEQVIDTVAELAETLLRYCPELRIVATSREPLGIGGEVTLRVPPLSAPAPGRQLDLAALPSYHAVTLFTERAAAVVPGFALTEDNMADVAGICHRLEGLPLPIELAAGRLAALSPDQILQRLTDRFALLTRGGRTAPTRQQALRLSVDWSHELCTPQEQQLWARLSVFAGSFELTAVEQVCGADLSPEMLLDLVASLVEKSILIHEGSATAGRYGLLDTIREYGLEKLAESGEYKQMRRRHLDWYERLALRAEADWIGPRQLDWIARLELDQQNFREALDACMSEPSDVVVGLRIAAALYPFWLTSGKLSEGARWTERLLTVEGVARGTEWVRAVSLGAVLSGFRGDIATGAEWIGWARAAAADLDDPNAAATALYGAGNVALSSNDISTAATCFDDALDACPPDEHLLRVATLAGAEVANGLLGQAVRAADCLDQVLNITEPRGEIVFRAWAVRALGLTVWSTDPQRAIALIEQALRLLRSVGDSFSAAPCLEYLAWIATADEDYARSAVLLGCAQAMRQTGGLPRIVLPSLRSQHYECERRTRRALGQKAYDASHRKGASASFEEAVAYALDDFTESPEPPRSRGSTGKTKTTLTRRELQVAELVAEGLTNSAIAAKLVISQRTAQGHVEHILAKLGFTSRAQIAAWTIEHSRG